MRPVAATYIALAVVLTGVCGYFAFLSRYSGTVTFWVLAGGPSVVLAAVAVEWARREELLRDWLRPRAGDVTGGVLGAVLLVAASWFFARVVAPVGSPREIWLATLYGQIGNPVSLRAHGAEVAAVIVVSAVSEEIVWRGMVTQLLADRLGSRTAWVWSAALYALAMVPTAWSLGVGGSLDPALVIAGFGGGLLWGYMTRSFGRLTTAIVAHMAFDWAVIMMFPLWGPG